MSAELRIWKHHFQARGFKELQRQIRTLVGTSRGEIRLNDIHNFFCYIFKDHIVPNYILDVFGPNYADESNENSTFKVMKTFRLYQKISKHSNNSL